MWNVVASEVGGRLSCARPIQNNFTRALLHVSTSGTPYILQMNFSVDITMWSVTGPLPRPNRAVWCCWNTCQAGFFLYRDHWTETHYYSQWQHGMLVGCPVVPLKGSGGSHVLVNILEPLMFQPSCIVVCNLFCYNGPAVEAHRCHVLV